MFVEYLGKFDNTGTQIDASSRSEPIEAQVPTHIYFKNKLILL